MADGVRNPEGESLAKKTRRGFLQAAGAALLSAATLGVLGKANEIGEERQKQGLKDAGYDLYPKTPTPELTATAEPTITPQSTPEKPAATVNPQATPLNKG